MLETPATFLSLMFGSLHDVALDMGLNTNEAVALERELARGWNAKQALEKQRALEAAQEAEALRGHRTLSGLGKCVLTLPQQEYEEIVAKYGYDAFADRGFIRDMQRLEPQTRVHRA